MRRPNLALASIGVILALTSGAPASQTYTVVVLQPDGYGPATYGTGISGNNQQVGYSIGGTHDTNHALLWAGSGNGLLDLNPSGYYDSVINGTDGSHQIGTAFANADGESHAIVWSGSASAFRDLHPAGYVYSDGYGIGGGQAVGMALASDAGHAIVWDIATGVATDLRPHQGYTDTWAYATDGASQVGVGHIQGPGVATYHAMFWSGTPDSATDLNPSGAFESEAYGVSGDQVVGAVNHTAALWVGPNHVYVGLGGNIAVATNGTQQVGTFGNDAAVWSGTAESMVNLGQFLPSSLNGSRALSIDAQGDIIGYAGGINGAVAVMWIPVAPEPEMALLTQTWLLAILLRKRYKQS